MSEVFSTDDFLNIGHDDLPPDKSTPIPANDYDVQIGVDEKALKMAGGEKDGKPWKRLDVLMAINDPAGRLKETHGDTPTIRYGVMIDLDENTHRFDFGPNRNVKVGKLLEAAGVRKRGWKFTDLYGKRLKIKVVNKPDKDDPTVQRAEIVAVTAPTN